MLARLNKAYKNFKRSIRHRRKILAEAASIRARGASHHGPKIFIDCGFNQGRVMEIFACAMPEFQFYGFEANANFRLQAEQLQNRYKNIRELKFAAVSNRDGEADFFIAGAETGQHIREGSTLVHGKDAHQTDFTQPTRVQLVDFSRWLNDLVAKYSAERKPFIALKIDIEGAEYDVLEQMITSGVLSQVDYLMVEFHSYCFTGAQKSEYEAREQKLLAELKQRPLFFSQWF